jgi:2-oxoglutarate dehydrogenase complex dehydrogenase (E1) component-like enzyme
MSRYSQSLKVLPYPTPLMGSGDVKYHLGYSSEVETDTGKKINLKLCPNPSHLETVGPVVIGFARSKADVLYNSNYDQILPYPHSWRCLHSRAGRSVRGIANEQS